jgi:predicted N-acetyltransferase YhbS
VKHGDLYNWEPRRWEGLLFHRNSSDLADTRVRIAQSVGILDDESGIRAVAIDEYPGGYHLQSHRGDVEAQQSLVDWAWDHQKQVSTDGKHWLEVWVEETDADLAHILRTRGFRETGQHQIRRRLDLTAWQPPKIDTSDYVVRSVTAADHASLAELLNAAFGRSIHSAEEYGNFAQLAPSYLENLEIVAVNEINHVVAHAGITAHPEVGFCVVEPVCTHPEHTNKGLARAAMVEGLIRARDLGVSVAYVEAWFSNPVSNHTYQSLGFTRPRSEYIWRCEET